MSEKTIYVLRWLTKALLLVMSVAGVLAATKTLPVAVQHYAALAVAILGAVYGQIHSWLPAPDKKPTLPPGAAAGLIALLALGLMLSAGCKSPYAVAWRTLDGVQQAQRLTATQLAATGKARNEACLTTHGAGTDGYKTCVEPTREMLRHWQTEARPAIVSAVQITASSLQIAEKVKADPKVKWLELIKPAVCALARVAKLFAGYLPDGGASIKSVAAMAEGVTCGR